MVLCTYYLPSHNISSRAGASGLVGPVLARPIFEAKVGVAIFNVHYQLVLVPRSGDLVHLDGS